MTTTRRRVTYPESDGKPMGETEVHVFELIRVLLTLRAWFSLRPEVYVGGNMMFYWIEGNPRASISPDVFVVIGARPSPPRRTFKVWEEGLPPTAVFEITSRKTRREDQNKKRGVYESIGVQEYVLYDPLGEYLRPPLQVLRLTDGAYQPVAPEPDGSLVSEALGLTLRLVDGRLRFFDRATGAWLFSSDELAAAAVARANEEAARADEEAARANEEAAARRAVEARNAELEARLRERDARNGRDGAP
jgi:Uma2 family endonuclease